MAAYWKQREHALGGDHITIPDKLEKNGQPQNDKKEIWNEQARYEIEHEFDSTGASPHTEQDT